MKQYRIKNKTEFEKAYGSSWREETDFPESKDKLLGKILPDEVNALINKYGDSQSGPGALFLRLIGINTKHLVEIPQISCDIDKVYVNDKKKTVVVKLRNGNEGKSKCSPEDTYDRYVGFAVAYARAIAGSASKLRKYVDTKLYGRKGGKKPEEPEKIDVKEPEKKAKKGK